VLCSSTPICSAFALSLQRAASALQSIRADDIDAICEKANTIRRNWEQATRARRSALQPAIVSELLTHLYVLIPVFDDPKHCRPTLRTSRPTKASPAQIAWCAAALGRQ
jgi:hypothetical protein